MISNTRGTPKRAELAFEIYGVTGGQRIEEYKGLQALKSAGGQADTGSVRSGVWKPPRISALLRSQRRLLYPAAGRDRLGGAAFTNEQIEGQLCATHIGRKAKFASTRKLIVRLGRYDELDRRFA